jgi:hypothetical protein
MPRQLFVQKKSDVREQAAFGGPGWVSCSVPPAATRSGKSARPDSSQPGCGNTNNLSPSPVAHTDQHTHTDQRTSMGSILNRKLLAHL